MGADFWCRNRCQWYRKTHDACHSSVWIQHHSPIQHALLWLFFLKGQTTQDMQVWPKFIQHQTDYLWTKDQIYGCCEVNRIHSLKIRICSFLGVFCQNCNCVVHDVRANSSEITHAWLVGDCEKLSQKSFGLGTFVTGRTSRPPSQLCSFALWQGVFHTVCVTLESPRQNVTGVGVKQCPSREPASPCMNSRRPSSQKGRGAACHGGKIPHSKFHSPPKDEAFSSMTEVVWLWRGRFAPWMKTSTQKGAGGIKTQRPSNFPAGRGSLPRGIVSRRHRDGSGWTLDPESFRREPPEKYSGVTPVVIHTYK